MHVGDFELEPKISLPSNLVHVTVPVFLSDRSLRPLLDRYASIVRMAACKAAVNRAPMMRLRHPDASTARHRDVRQAREAD
jgi:hypothetical protein